MQEYEYEPIKGLPEELPEGEYVVWQGSPAWQALAVRVFHTRKLAIYFALLISAHLIYQVMNGAVMSDIALSVSWQLLLSATALGLMAGAAKWYAKKAVFTFTNRRLVLRSGVALPMMVQVPWDSVASAGLHVCDDGTGDILITPKNDRKFYYMLIWPFVRPWHFGHVQPLLRGIIDPEVVAKRLAEVIDEERNTESTSTLRATQVDEATDHGAFHEQPIPAS
jgi:hypothetical protein